MDLLVKLYPFARHMLIRCMAGRGIVNIFILVTLKSGLNLVICTFFFDCVDFKKKQKTPLVTDVSELSDFH